MKTEELIKQIKELVTNAPEINFANYDVEQVREQDNALIEIHQLITLYEKQLNEETRKDSVKVCQCYRSTPGLDSNGNTYCKKCGLKC